LHFGPLSLRTPLENKKFDAKDAEGAKDAKKDKNLKHE